MIMDQIAGLAQLSWDEKIKLAAELLVDLETNSPVPKDHQQILDQRLKAQGDSKEGISRSDMDIILREKLGL